MGLGELKGYNGTNVFETTTAQNDTKPRRVQTPAPPDKGYTRIWVEVHSSAQKGKDGKVMLSEEDVERALFNRFGLHTDTQADLQKLKDRLGTTDNPFAAVKRSNASRIEYRADGKYRIQLDVKNPLYTKLSGRAAQIRQQIKNEKQAQSGDAAASKKVFDAEQYNRAKLGKLLKNVDVLPSSFGIPSKLTDKTHVVLTLPEGTAPTDDSALTAYIEKRFGGGNLFGDDKREILNAAKQSGVKVENLKVSPNTNRVVGFDLDLESMLKLQKSYLDVQEKANNAIDAADKIKEQMALNQFLLGIVEGAKDDISGNINAIAHPIETFQGIGDALGILSKLTAEDLKNIAAELGSKAANATPGEAAHAAGYVVGTVIVEALLAKGAGAALSALGKTKAGAEFLARIGKLKELVSLGKAKVAEAFTDEAAGLAKQKFFQRLRELGLSPNNITNLAADPELWGRALQIAGNAVSKGYTKFAAFKTQVIKELGEIAEPQLKKLYRESLISLDLSQGKQVINSSGKVIDEAIVKEAKEKVIELTMNGQSKDVAELKEYLHQIGNKYGTEFENELKKTVEQTVDNVYEGRRTPEIHDLLGGHTIYDMFNGEIDTKHIGKTIEQLKERLAKQSGIEYASSFTNLERANKAQREFIKHYEKEIAEWLKSGSTKPFERKLELGTELGNVVGRGKFGTKSATKVQAVLAKDGTEQGWHIATSFPVR